MKPPLIVVGLVSILSSLSGWAADFTEVPDSTSPDGVLAARTEPSKDVSDGQNYLSLYRKKTGEVADRLPLGGYAAYPMDADPVNLRLLWAPDSKHFALMLRGTKRSWTTTVYAIGPKGLKEVKLPDLTAKALKVVSGSEIDRVSRETPSKWIDSNTLLLRASGNTTVDGKSIWFEVDLTCSLKTGKITEAKVVETRSYEG
jgi:hypothetical protein